MSQPHSYYDNLGLTHDAPPALIKAARDALLQKYSKENFPNDDEELNRIRNVINASYDALITPQKRAAHNAWLATSVTARLPVLLPTPNPIEPIFVEEQKTKHAKNSTPLTGVLVGGLLLAIVIGFILSSNSTKSTVGTATLDAPPVSAAPKSDVNKYQDATVVFQPDLGVASINANLREFDSVKSKVLRVVPRATLLKKLSSQGAFVQVQLADGAKGWIAEELLLPQADVIRLNNTTAKAYIQENSGEARLQESWNTVFPAARERMLSLLLQLEQKNPAIQNNITLLEFMALDKPKLDASALVWFGQSVLLEKENAKPTEALLASRAAIVAAPYDAGAYTALGIAAYEAGDKISLDSAALMALGLSPKTTNTWVVMGLSLGADVKTSRHAVGAFMLAIKFSRNGSFTKKYLLDLADKATNPNLPPVLREAVNEMNSNPNSFAQN
jgi:hypothetical protein